MTAERWQQIKELFHSALERQGEARDAFLNEACAGDEELKREVESLLASSVESESIFETPVAAAAAQLLSSEHSASLLGKQLNHYEITALIGEGGMGAVYLARDKKLGRRVALKLLPSFLTNDADRLRRFEREASTASALNHPNILTIYEIGESDRSRFIATEFIDGMTLRELIAQSRMELPQVLDIAIQVTSALVAAHRVNIVHRDIKPENIMVRRDDRLVKVLDFGLAKETERPGVVNNPEALTRTLVKTAPGIVMGTVAYMSPEQARGLAVDERTDIWSLGVVLYEMISGKAPFAGTTFNEIISEILSKEQPAPLTRFTQNLPPKFDRIISKALAKDREERYQSAKDLLVDLNRLKHKPEVGVAAPTKKEREVKIGRNLWLVVALLTCVLIIALGAIVVYRSRTPVSTASATPIRSIAVLPLKNLSDDREQQYFSDGMTDSLITALSEIKDLKVISHSSVFYYQNSANSPQEIGKQLGVAAVLEGSVRKSGDSVRIAVRLVNTEDGSVLWASGSIDRKIQNVFSLQDEVARNVAAGLRLRLGDAEERRFAKRPTANAEAYELYLQGEFSWFKWDGRSLGFYQQATQKDPNFALAYIGIAESYLQLIGKNEISAREGMLKARAAITKALELDGNLAEAQNALAEIKYQLEYDWTGAEKDFQKALELNPNSGQIRLAYGSYLMSAGRFSEALPWMERARDVDPHNRLIAYMIATFFYFTRQFDKSLEHFRRLLVLEPNDRPALVRIGEIYELKGMYAEAVEHYLLSESIREPLSPEEIEVYRKGFKDSGFEGYLRIRRARLEQSSKDFDSVSVAQLYARLGDNDRAFAWLEKALEERSPWIIQLRIEPMFDNLRSDARYTKLLKRMNITP